METKIEGRKCAVCGSWSPDSHLPMVPSEPCPVCDSSEFLVYDAGIWLLEGKSADLTTERLPADHEEQIRNAHIEKVRRQLREEEQARQRAARESAISTTPSSALEEEERIRNAHIEKVRLSLELDARSTRERSRKISGALVHPPAAAPPEELAFDDSLSATDIATTQMERRLRAIFESSLSDEQKLKKVGEIFEGSLERELQLVHEEEIASRSSTKPEPHDELPPRELIPPVSPSVKWLALASALTGAVFAWPSGYSNLSWGIFLHCLIATLGVWLCVRDTGERGDTGFRQRSWIWLVWPYTAFSMPAVPTQIVATMAPSLEGGSVFFLCVFMFFVYGFWIHLMAAISNSIGLIRVQSPPHGVRPIWIFRGPKLIGLVAMVTVLNWMTLTRQFPYLRWLQALL